MSSPSPRDTARDILRIVPLVMRTVAAELRASGELPAPAHFGLLMTIAVQPRTLSELAGLQGVSRPTISNSIARLVERGWIRRMSPPEDRRLVFVEITPRGRAAVNRVSRAAEAHLVDRLASLDPAARSRLRNGLAVLRDVFADATMRRGGTHGPARPGRRGSAVPTAGR